MNAVDTSIAVPALTPWHDAHETAVRIVETRTRLIGHVAVETYSVVTRLPRDLRVASDLAMEFLRDSFDRPLLTLSGDALDSMLASLPDLDISGGAVYDALVAATAKTAGATLLTMDARASSTYERIGCETAFID